LVLEESVPSISECGGGVSQPSDDIETWLKGRNVKK
jgi:hypothetical protein